MKISRKIFVMVFIAIASQAHAQQNPFSPPTPQNNIAQLEKQYLDSLQRIMMRDSLSLTNNVITQVFSIRDNYISQAAQIRTDSSRSQGQKADALQTLRIETDNSTKELLGELTYQRYMEMIIGRRNSQ